MGYNDQYAGRIVIDIETVASPEAGTFLDPVKAPSNYKDAAKIAAYCQEKQTELVDRAGLEPDLCEVVAIGYRYNSDPIATVGTRKDGEEGELLTELWKHVDRRALIGFNILGFDLPVLIRRSQLLGVTYPDLNLDRYRTPHIDLLERLTFHGKLTYRSLAFYCRRFGIPCEDTSTGKDIAALVAANDWAAVAWHCRSDVEKTAALAARLHWLTVPETEAVA